MPASEPSRVFISYARKDVAALAQRLQSDLAKQGFDAWLDTERIAGGAVRSTEIEREIDTRQVTLALLSPGSYGSEICRAEQLRVLDKGNRVIPVVAPGNFPFYDGWGSRNGQPASPFFVQGEAPDFPLLISSTESCTSIRSPWTDTVSTRARPR